MTRILLTGAGFSRNWGGWLATEAFEYLLGCPEIDAELRNRLWQSKSTGGGFEDLLADLQEEHARSKNARSEKPLKNLEAALYGMFQDMDLGFVSASLNTGDSRYHLRHFLVQFDAIFTLNQDLLLERHYLNGNIELSNARKWIGWQMPGLKFVNPTPHTYSTFDTLAMRKPDPTLFKEEGGLQPYFKLHGSSNWVGDNGERLLVMGGNKAVAIRQQPLLQWYHQLFERYLARGTRLMAIGYSYSDHYINHMIMQAADERGLELFIIDPKGVAVLDKQNPKNPIRVPNDLMASLNRHIIGASQRPINVTFGHDPVEHGKIMRFFAK